MKFKSDIEVQAGLKDSSGAAGTSGQVLSSNGTTVSWVNPGGGVASDVQNLVKAGVAINKGQAVYVTSADGTNIIVGLASNTAEATSSKTLGLLDATVAINGMANVVQVGRLEGLDTSTAIIGDPVWLGTNGNLIYGLANKPYAPAHLVYIGVVTRVNANNGEIFISVQNGFELNEIHDVDLKTTVPTNGNILGYNGSLWVNKTIPGWLGYTPQAALNGTGFVKISGTTISYDNSTYLTSAVTTFSGGTTGLTPNTATSGAVTLAGTLVLANGGTGSTTAAGARTNLGATTLGANIFTSANPGAIRFLRANADNTASWLDAATFRTAIGAGTGSGTVTSVAALTIGTTGTDVTSTVATGTTTPVITLNLPTASAVSRGVLNNTDWTTFNSKQNALNGTGFVKVTGTTVSYDNSTYALDNAVVKLTGDQGISGQKSFNLVQTGYNLTLRTSDIFNDGFIESNNGMLRLINNTTGNDLFRLESTGVLFGQGFKKSGGISSQFLKADGTVDSTAYLSGTVAIANGGTGATTAAAARTGLGATTVGSNIFTLANPGAITFPRFNADNTVSALDAASFRTAIGAGTGGGTVTSIATSGAITGGTITTTGTISHSTADGFLHVPATGTTNNGKVLTAGATAGTFSWQTPASGGVTSVSGTGGYGGLTLSGTVTSTGNLTLAGTPTGTWPISVSGNAATTSLVSATSGGAISSWDIRTISPSSMGSYRMGFGFTSWNNNSGAPYADYLHLRSYSDSSGGSDNLVVFNKSAIGMRIYQQTFGSTTAYSSYKDMAFTDGTNATGNWGINITGASRIVNAPTYNTPAILVNSSGTGSTGSAIGMQQVTAEGWTGIFVDFEPNTGWGLYHDNPSNYFLITAETTTGSIGSNLVPSRYNGNRTAHTKFQFQQTDAVGIAGGSWRAPVFYDFNDTSYYIDPNSATTSAQLAGAIEQGNNLSRPLVQWGVSGNVTGAVVIKLPGVSSTNYGMIHAVIDIYEYNGNNVSTVIVGGHNWSTQWYNMGAQVIGKTNKQVRLAVKDGKYCIVLGDGTSVWEYGQVVLRKIQNGPYYNNVMDLGGAYSIGIESDTYSWVSSDLRRLDSQIIIASSQMQSPIFYDYNDTAYYINPGDGDISAILKGTVTIGGGTGGNYDEGLRIIDSGGFSVAVFGASGNAGAGRFQFVKNNSDAFELRNASGSQIWWVNQSGNTVFNTDVRSPIFYDSNDTSYYADFNSTSNSAIRVRGGALHGPNPTWGYYLLVGGDGRNGYIDNTTTASVCTTNGNLHIDSASGMGTYINFYDGSVIYFGGGASNIVGSATSAGNLVMAGDVTAYGSPSDSRLKTIKEKVPNALESVLKLNGYRFDWKNPGEILNIKEDIGVIAQEVEAVFPELARTNEDGFMSVRHQGLTAVLIEAIKEQQTQIEELKQLVNQLINK